MTRKKYELGIYIIIINISITLTDTKVIIENNIIDQLILVGSNYITNYRRMHNKTEINKILNEISLVCIDPN